MFAAPGGRVATPLVRLPAQVTSAAAARRFVREAFTTLPGLGPDISPTVVDDAALVASELVTNAIIHGGRSVKLSLRVVDGEYVELSVADDVYAYPERRVPSTERPGGVGLLIVETLGAAWGTESLVGGKAVWCRLRLRPAAP